MPTYPILNRTRRRLSVHCNTVVGSVAVGRCRSSSHRRPSSSSMGNGKSLARRRPWRRNYPPSPKSTVEYSSATSSCRQCRSRRRCPGRHTGKQPEPRTPPTACLASLRSACLFFTGRRAELSSACRRRFYEVSTTSASSPVSVPVRETWGLSKRRRGSTAASLPSHPSWFGNCGTFSKRRSHIRLPRIQR